MKQVTTFGIFITIVLFGQLIYSQMPPPPPPAPGSSAPAYRQAKPKMDAATRSNLLAKAGGMIQQSNSGSTVVLVLNDQKTLPKQVAVDAVGRLQRFLLFPFDVKDAEQKGTPRELITQTLKDKKVGAVILLIEAKDEPALLVAPEARWAVVNVSALVAETQEVHATRVRKEIARAFGYLLGTAHSAMDGCVMKSVLKAEDLDQIRVETVSPESLNKVLAQAKLLGIQPARMVPYRKACEEGWAPMPTNAMQKAVWEEVKGKK
jgi:hypothetical protein